MAAHSAKLDPDNAEYLTISQASSYIHIESREKCMGVGLSLEAEARVRGSVPTAASPTPPHHRSRRSAANSPRPPYCSPCLPAAARRCSKKQSARAVASRAARGCTVHRRLRGRHCACCARSTRSTPPPSLSRRAGQQRFNPEREKCGCLNSVGRKITLSVHRVAELESTWCRGPPPPSHALISIIRVSPSPTSCPTSHAPTARGRTGKPRAATAAAGLLHGG